MKTQNKIRNIAIIAHVDHGKTTLVDAMLKQTKTFADHQKEMGQTTILDSNELEREKGVTILAKNTSVHWDNYLINILDTPGHADFSGEVERVLNMVDGCLLLVDAAEGVLSQTKFVLRLALKIGLQPIVVINKVDRKDQRAKAVENEIEDLFLDLAETDEQLSFPVLYARGIDGVAGLKTKEKADHSLAISDSNDLAPLFKTIIQTIPAPTGDQTAPLQLQVASLDWDDHKGKIAWGRITQGTIAKNQKVLLTNQNGKKNTVQVEYLYMQAGLNRREVDTAEAGNIVAVAGLPQPQIGDTITDPDQPELAEPISISEPTVKIKLSTNTSPFAGLEAEFSTSRQIKNRLEREIETNVGLRIIPDESGESITLVGRGELHLAILIETMRREGYEFSLARPEVVIKEKNGQKLEPWETVMIEVPEEYLGTITNSMAARKAEMVNMQNFKDGIRFEYEIATRNLIGYRSELLTKTSGTGVLHSNFLEFRPQGKPAEWHRGGAIIAHETGTTTAYALEKAQQRATMLVNPGEEVYRGQVVGINNREQDMHFNVCKGKKLTNMRAASADKTVVLAPAMKPSLEHFLTMIAPDEVLEVTPKNLRLRKEKREEGN